MNEILWGFQRTNNDYELQLLYKVLKYFDDINIDSSIFLNDEINDDFIKIIEEKIKDIAIDILDDEQDATLEYILAVILIKASVNTKKIFIKLDQIERHFSSLKWRFYKIVKIIACSKNQQRYKSYVKSLQKLSEKEILKYVKNGIPIYSTIVKGSKQYYENSRQAWKTNRDITLLWGDTGLNHFNLEFEGARTAFYVLYVLNTPKYIELIQKFHDPYSCRMALHAIDIELDHTSQWLQLVEKADQSFNQHGIWDTSKLLLPLLMEVADNKLKAFEISYNLTMHSSQEEIDYVITKINSIIEFIISHLIDKSLIGTLRWMLYKIKNSRNFDIVDKVEVKQNEYPNINDYVSYKYIDVFCNSLSLDHKHLQITWNDPLDYEYLHLCILQTYMIYSDKHEGDIDNIKDFFRDWSFNTNTWYEDLGNKFRVNLKYLYVSDDQIGFIADKYRLLAFLLFKSIRHKGSLKDWHNLLITSDLFLDILKYSKNKEKKTSFDNKMASRDSLHLIARIGLDLLLIFINERDEEKAILVHDALFSLYFKGLERDFSPSFYFKCIQLLALLRIYSEIDSNSNNIYTILNNTKYDLQDYLTALRPHSIMYAEFIYFLHINGLNRKSLVERDLIPQIQSQIDILESMLQLGDRHYQLPPQILEVLKNSVTST